MAREELPSVRLDPVASMGVLGLPPSRAGVFAGPPSQLGRHTVLHLLGRGGMGEVYEAVDARLLRRVAVKVLVPGLGAEAARRLVAESQVTGQLEHPNIVPAHELGIDEQGRVYYTMKLVRGESLAERIDRWGEGPLTAARIEEIVTVVRKVCDAMAFAHAKGVVHRDLKPGNVMLGEFHEVLVADWGLARVVGSEDLVRVRTRPANAPPTGRTPRTVDGLVVGTPAYMSPEQARGENEAVGPICDVYSLGAILYHMLTGQAPVDDPEVDLVLRRVVAGDIVPVQQRAPHRRIPAELAAVVAKAMAVDPRFRYPSAAALESDLAAFQAQRAVSAHHEGTWSTLMRLVRRNRFVVAALLTALVLGLVGVAYSWDAHVRARGGAERAAQALARSTAQANRAAAAEHEQSRVQEATEAQSRRRVAALPAFTEASDLLQRRQRPERAAALLAQAIAIDPTFVEAHYALGQAEDACGDYRSAVSAFMAAADVAAAAGTVHLPALLAAGRVQEELGEFARAETAYRRLVAADPEHPLGRVGQAMLSSHYGHVEAALVAARHAVEKGAHLWETHRTLGGVILDGIRYGILPPERMGEAIACLRRALELQPNQIDTMFELASALQVDPSPTSQREAEDLRRPCQARPAEQTNVICLSTCTHTALEHGDMKTAAEAIERLRQLKASPMLVEYFQANLDLRQGDGAGAIGHMQRVIDSSPDWPLLRFCWLNIALMNKQNVLRETREFLRTNPDYPPAYQTLMLAEFRQGNYDEVEATGEEGLKRAPYSGDMYHVLANLQYSHGESRKALATLERAAALLPKDFSVQEMRIEILLQIGCVAEAAKMLEGIRRNFPFHQREVAALQAKIGPVPGGVPR